MRVSVGQIRRWRGWPDSGPRVARAFQVSLAVVFVVAWISLGVQIEGLVGESGLVPWVDFLKGAPQQGQASWFQMPTFFLWGCTDLALRLGAIAGVVLGGLAFIGVAPRRCFAASLLLYLSYVVVGRPFTSFQWDLLLLECAFLALFLPTDRAAPWAHFLFRVLFFKLYVESGIAKWQSYLQDWHDGSAMTFYYETAPIPGLLSWYAHQLPPAWHAAEGWVVLALELLLPLGVFFSRRLRLLSFACLTVFQLLNVLTANYGFFCYLSVALHLFMLDDRDLQRIGAWVLSTTNHWPGLRAVFAKARLSTWMGAAQQREFSTAVAVSPLLGDRRRFRRGAYFALAFFYVGISASQALEQFAQASPRWVHAWLRPYNIINTYHLFGHITRQRIEPEFQVRTDGQWLAINLHHKPGPLQRHPALIAPHQPRLDFQLWFHGLRRRRAPAYVVGMLKRLCGDQHAVQQFFVEPLPRAPQAVRVNYWQYEFTTLTERDLTGDWWRRSLVAEGRTLTCAHFAD